MPYIAVRDPFADAKETLSSWDKCMAKDYCKWPVIVVIVIGGLILFSVVMCLVRCICCGVECACCCFRCCSGCCGGCGGSGRSKHKKIKDAPPPDYSSYRSPIPPPPIDNRPFNQQYRSHAAPAYAPSPERLQFATFETPSRPVNEDSLPSMPTWGEAKKSHIEEVMPEKSGDVEMDRLDHNGSVTGTSVSGAAIGGAARRSPGRSPVERTQQPHGYGFPAGYQNDPYTRPGTAQSRPDTAQRPLRSSPAPYGAQHGQQQDNYYVSPIEPQSLSPVYGGAGGYAQNQQHGSASPSQGYNNQHYNAPHNQNDGHAPVALVRSPSPHYAPSATTRYGSPAPAYPGQQTYESTSEAGYPGQQTYQAFQPQAQQSSGVVRKPMDGSWN